MNILISGATGKMGHVLYNSLKATKHQVIAGYAAEAGEDLPFPVYLKLGDCPEKEQIDVIIDFSSATTLDSLLAFACENRIPLVIASTGFSEKQEEQIVDAAQKLPIFHSKNMSLGVNIMQQAVAQIAAALQDFDIEIVEKHHRYKKDSPSGTAKMLFDAANRGRGQKLTELDGRAGLCDGRTADEVGISAIRGGTIVGEHSVIFAGEDEILEIKHTANSRAIFAAGAIKAAEFIILQENGLYDMSDLLNTK